MSSEVARVLREVADLIEPPGRWTKGALARSETGAIVAPSDAEATCWCIYGALIRTVPRNVQLCSQATDMLRQQAGPYLGFWNDEQKSVEPVVAALRAAADEAERADA